MDTLQDYPVPEPSVATGAVRTLNKQYIDAARTSDVEWFRAHMSDDVVVILGSGRRVRKEEFLSLLITEPRNYRSLTVRDATIRVFGTTVQVDADAPWELSDGKRGISRYIDTYAWIDCSWKVISAQINWLPESAGS